MLFLLSTLFSLLLTSTYSVNFTYTCSDRRIINEPISVLHGDFVIAGVFWMGNVAADVMGVEYCNYTHPNIYGVQRALAFRETVFKEKDRFKSSLGVSLGYAIYDNCGSAAITGRVSYHLANNPNVIGVLGADHGDFVKISAYTTTAYSVPTVTYMYNEKELMNPEDFPTMLSLIETKENEARIIAQFLKKMEYTYMDIMYHSLSEGIGKYLHERYLPGNSCGRVQEVSNTSDVEKIFEKMYNKTNETASEVQLILQNSKGTTEKWLKHAIQDKGFRNKIYITGTSNGRLRYHEKVYRSILQEVNGSDDTFVFPLPYLLNIQPKELEIAQKLRKPWIEDHEEVDKLYKRCQLITCPNESCSVTSWISYVVAATKIIFEALKETVERNAVKDPITDCKMSIAKFRDDIFKRIINESREVDIELNEQTKFRARFRKSTLNVPMKIRVYQSKIDQFNILGEVSLDSINITNTPLLENISHYQKKCAEDCAPGSHRVSPGTLSNLPCCWQCIKCTHEHYTNQINENHCNHCEDNETSNENMTGCIDVNIVYIKVGSHLFIGGVSLVILGIILVFLTTGLVWRHESRPVIRASDTGYLYMVLVSIAVGFCGSLTSLLEPTQSTCTAEYVMVIFYSALITSNLVWKCIKIYGIFSAANNFEKPKFAFLLKRPGQLFLNITSIVFIVIFFFIDGLVTGFCWKFRYHQDHDHGVIYPMCKMEDGYKHVICILPVTLPLCNFLTTLVFVFKMRSFPHNFKETLNILTATLIVSFCGIIFLSGYSSSPPQIRALLRFIIVYMANLAFLVCLFLPKVLVLVRPGADAEEERARMKESLRSFAGRISTSTTTRVGYRVSTTEAQVSGANVEERKATITESLETVPCPQES